MKRKQEAYNYLLEGILSSRFAPGSPIVETEISEALSISRTPVREALKDLESNGFVTIYPNTGSFVTPITPYDVEEIFNLRIYLELCALQASYNRVPSEELDRVEAIFAAICRTSTKDEWHLADRILHSLIVDTAGNYRLKHFLNILANQIERFRRTSAQDTERMQKSKEEHLEIIQAMRRRDLKACEEKLIYHLNSVKNSTLEVARLQHLQKR